MGNVISNRIKYLRKCKGVLQEEVAGYLGVSRTTYSGYETGRIIPPADKITELAKYFKVTSDYIMGATNDSNLSTPLTEVQDLAEQLDFILEELNSGTIAVKYKGILLNDEQKADVLPLIKSSIRMLDLLKLGGKYE